MQEKLDGLISKDVFKAGNALAGGVARQGETCGALTGALMAVGLVVGRERIEDVETYQKAMKHGIRIHGLFREKVGHSLCCEIQKRRHGRAFKLFLPEEQEAFHAAGGHSRKGCPEVCGIAARIAAEFILDNK